MQIFFQPCFEILSKQLALGSRGFQLSLSDSSEAMELPIPISTRLHLTSRIPFITGLVNFRSPNNDNRRTRLRRYLAPVRAELSSDVSHKSGDPDKSVVTSVNSNCRGSSLKGEEGEGLFHRNVWEDTDFVEVIGIGSRKDAILDFCLASSSRFPALRFWYATIHTFLCFSLRDGVLM